MDGSPRICELVEYYLEDIRLKGAWTGPAALSLQPHALAPVAELPVLEVISAVHLVADLTLGLGRVVHDYLVQEDEPDAAALVTVLRDRLECEVEALDALLAREVMVEYTGPEEQEKASKPNLSLRLAPEAGG